MYRKAGGNSIWLPGSCDPGLLSPKNLQDFLSVTPRAADPTSNNTGKVEVGVHVGEEPESLGGIAMGHAAGQQITKQQLAVFGASLRDSWDRPFAPSVSLEYDGVSTKGGVVGWMYPWMGNGFLFLFFFKSDVFVVDGLLLYPDGTLPKVGRYILPTSHYPTLH